MPGNKFWTTGANGNAAEVHGVQVSAGTPNANAIPALTAAGVFDSSLMPSGIAPDTAQLTASETISAGSLVNIWSNGGVFSARNADASTIGKEAHGFVLSPATSGAAATVFFGGSDNAQSGLSPGVAFLSATAVGQTQTTPPNAGGQTVQRVGFCVSATVLMFTPGLPIALS